MKYNSLKVWDAENKILAAHFKKESNNLFSIIVNDDNAVYPVTIDPLSNTANWIAESNQIEAHFGASVSTAGDVNGDGYSDVIIGAPYYDNGETDEGRAYVYYGSASGLSATANWTADESDQYSARFGASVSTVGDVNGDGYSDVIVGAPYYDNGETDEGRAYVYYGNNGGGVRSTIQQYQAGTSTIVGPHGKTGVDGQIRFNGFAKSPFGRADGKLVYEYAANGSPFGSTVNSSGTQSTYTDLGTTISGIQLNEDESGILTMKNYRWRERIKYSPVNNPYQVYGPWRYYTSYQPLSFGSFKPQNDPMPVELATFIATSNSSSVTLHWKTATEVNNYGFEVERRSTSPVSPPYQGGDNRGGWLKVGFVSGAGTSNAPHEYSYSDANLSSGRYVYRLKQIDHDGSFKYSESNEIEIGLVPRELTLAQNYPNPFNPTTTIEFTVPQGGYVSLTIYNTLGQLVETVFDGTVQAGYIQKATFNASRLQYNDKNLMKKIVLVK